MGRRPKLGDNLLIYLHVSYLAVKFRRPNGRSVPHIWCRSAVAKMYAKSRGENLSDGAIRAAYAQGRKIAEKLARKYGLPESLPEAQRNRMLTLRLSHDLNSAEIAERMASSEEDAARDRAHRDLTLQYAREILARPREILARPPRKKRSAKNLLNKPAK